MTTDGSYLIAIKNFNKILKSVTTPVIPAAPSEVRMNRIFVLHNILFYVVLSIAISSKKLENDLIAMKRLVQSHETRKLHC